MRLDWYLMIEFNLELQKTYNLCIEYLKFMNKKCKI